MTFRVAAALAALVVLVVWEIAAPRRRLTTPRRGRWLANGGLFAAGALVTAFASLTAFALACEERRAGVLHHLDWPYAAKFAVSFLALDLAVFLQHWAFHAAPWLWRFHKVHHTDLDLDATTALRFHPVELVLSLGVKVFVIAVLGAHFLAVAVFEAALSLSALFNHSNVALPRALDRVLRLLLVTPDMHRVHHSARAGEQDSNFGFCVPWWDRLFGTYEPEPADGHAELALGLSDHRDPRPQTAWWLLALPFREPAR